MVQGRRECLLVVEGGRGVLWVVKGCVDRENMVTLVFAWTEFCCSRVQARYNRLRKTGRRPHALAEPGADHHLLLHLRLRLLQPLPSDHLQPEPLLTLIPAAGEPEVMHHPSFPRSRLGDGHA